MSSVENYERKLRVSLVSDYLFLIFILIIVIGLVFFALWWYKSEKKESEELSTNYKESKDSKIDKKILIISILLITTVIIGATHGFITSIVKTTYDINNKAFVVVSEDFFVTEENWFGRWNNTTYTIEFEKDDQIITIHPNLKYCDLSAGKYTDLIFVYSLKSEIILDIYKKTESGKTGDGTVSPE